LLLSFSLLSLDACKLFKTGLLECFLADLLCLYALLLSDLPSQILLLIPLQLVDRVPPQPFLLLPQLLLHLEHPRLAVVQHLLLALRNQLHYALEFLENGQFLRGVVFNVTQFLSLNLCLEVLQLLQGAYSVDRFIPASQGSVTSFLVQIELLFEVHILLLDFTLLLILLLHSLFIRHFLFPALPQ